MDGGRNMQTEEGRKWMTHDTDLLLKGDSCMVL